MREEINQCLNQITTNNTFFRKVISDTDEKTAVVINKPIYLGQPILDISKTLMYEFWYGYIKPKHKEKAQLCYMDTNSFIIDIKTEDFYKDIAKDVNKWFDTSGYDKNDNRSLPIGKNKKVIGKFKDELNGMIMIKFCGPRLQTNNKIMTYPYATPAIKVCESELLSLIFKLKKKTIILEWEYLYQKK